MSDFDTPVIIVNLKAYSQVHGAGAVNLAQTCEQVALESGVSIAVAPPMVSLSAVAEAVDIPVFSQSIDPYTPGSRTGWVTAEMIAATAAAGTMINHSEHKYDADTIGRCVGFARDSSLITCICADTVDAAKDLARFSPDLIAVEPPELIGGDISVTTADPRVVSDTVSTVRSVGGKIAVLCGAGVKNGKDVAAALGLGADGVLLASGVVKAANPLEVMRDLASGVR